MAFSVRDYHQYLISQDNEDKNLPKQAILHMKQYTTIVMFSYSDKNHMGSSHYWVVVIHH